MSDVRARVVLLLTAAGLVGSAGRAVGQPQSPVCASQSTSYGATGTIQQFVVPPGVTSVTIDASGAKGGDGFSAGGGAGARLVASFPVVPGETLSVLVGSQGSAVNGGGGGGGATAIYRTATSTGALLVAAGGGGAGAFAAGPGGPGQVGPAQAGSGFGGGAAGTNGSGGGAGGGCPAVAVGAGGGGLLGDGASCLGAASGGTALASGGAGGAGAGGGSGGFGGGGGGVGPNPPSGGGGGGYSGGGGGGGFSRGGGGGGSYVNAAGTTLWSADGGAPAGDGTVTFCYAPNTMTVPAVSTTGLLVLGVLLAIGGALALRR